MRHVLYEALAAAVPDLSWLDAALPRVEREIAHLFPAAGRHCGRSTPLDRRGTLLSDSVVEGHPPYIWTAEDAARVLLLLAHPRPGDEVEALYRYGDAAEKRAVLRALPMLPIGDAAVGLLHDAIRTNDTRLVAAALGPYAVHLDDAAWRQGVLKCVFMGVPLSVVHGLAERADAELAAMLAALAAERRAAGREMPADALALLSPWSVSG